MKDRISHGGAGITVTEYEVRTIDKYGDAEDVAHYETKREALRLAQAAVTDGAIAVVVERHTVKSPSFLFSKPNVYIIVATYGDKAALEAGGWIE